jgi:hypothetical protein
MGNRKRSLIVFPLKKDNHYHIHLFSNYFVILRKMKIKNDIKIGSNNDCVSFPLL